MIKAAVVHAAGQPPSYSDFAEPVAGPDEHLVTVTAAALSHLARGRASGQHYSSAGRFPFVAGVDGVGRLPDGRRVFFMLPRAPFGAMAERTAVAAAQCLPLPDDLDDITAAALANPGMSSWAALTLRARLAPGETVLINGATGTSGRLAVQIAKHLGAGKVIATGRNPDRLQELRSFGADATLALGRDDDALEATFAGRVDVVLDYLWGDSARNLLIAAAKASPESVPVRFVQIGSMSGAEVALPAAVLRSSALVMMGSGLGSLPPDGLVGAIGALLAAAGPAGFRIAVRPVPLADVARAWADREGSDRMVFTVPA
jgi:NADPH:quinone reductase-like Zn-dependent oxidoreductase